MKKLMNRALSIVLAVTMCVGLLSLSAFAADVGDKCPSCGKGTIVADKSNPNHLICTDCAEFSGYVKPTESECKHGKTYLKDNQDGKTHSVYCTECEKPVSTAQHSFINGKCECGAQEPEHEHSWHNVTSFCSGTFEHELKCDCGAKETRSNTGERVYSQELGTYVIQCKYCEFWIPAEAVHNWETTGTHIEGTQKHTIKCGDDGCTATRTEDCTLVATQDGSGVYCTVCGWVKYDDGTPGGDESKFCKDGEHKFGNLYQHNDGYHWQQCMNCPYTTEHVQCDWKLMTVPGTNLASAYVCPVCGNTKPVNEGDIELCDPNNPKVSHNWVVNRTEKAEDGTMVVIVRCTNCGKEKIDGKCNSQEGFYTLTIHYQKPGGEPVFPDAVMSLAKNAPYSVGSPPLHGYDVEYDVVAGTMPGHDDVITVKYTPHEYKWTIKYVDEGDKELATAYETTYTVENVKGLTVPANPDVFGYKVKVESVTVPNSEELGNVEGKVVYEPIPYTWTINYVDENGEAMEGMEPHTETFNVNSIKTLKAVTSPTKAGYTADQPVVNAPTELGNVTVTVKYTRSAIYKLVVNHEYVALDGTRTVVTQTIGENYKVGDSYTTSAVARRGYSLSARPANATGVFGAEDVTVIYVYNADRTPTPEPDPDPTPEPPVDINEPEVPLIEDPDVDIEEPEVPLAKEPEIELEEPDVPLADVPETGDKSLLWGCLTLISGAGLALLALMDKKRKDDEA